MNRLSLPRRPWCGVVIALALLLSGTAPVAQATKLQKQNITQLIAASESIIGGVVTDVHDGIDDKGVPYTQVTIGVGASAKGAIKPQQHLTFRQFGLLAPRTQADGSTLLALTPEGFPSWRKGEYVVAFLHRAGTRTGLRTTAGLAQGKLSMINDRLVNAFDNAGLFDDVRIAPSLLSAEEQALLHSKGPVDMRTFMGLIGRAVRNGWVEKGVMQ